MKEKDTANSRKEIDLIDLMTSVGLGIKNFFIGIYNMCWWLLVFGIKNYLYVLIFGLVGLGYGLYNLTSFVPSYESQMTIRTNAMRSYEMKSYFEEITTYLEERDQDSDELIYELFGFDSITNSEIVSIESHFFIDTHGNGTIDKIDLNGDNSLADTINICDSLHLCLIANVTEPLIFPQLKNGFTKYLNSNPYVTHENKYRLDKLLKEKKVLEHEIQYLDSLQREIYFNSPKMPAIRQNNTGMFLGNVSTQTFHKEKLRLEDALKKIEKELELHTDVITILSDFKISKKKTKTDIVVLLYPTLILCFLGYFVALIIYFFKKNYKQYADKIK